MLTPEDIQSREFLVSLRGYDRDEVHAFLDEVAEEFANLLARSRGGLAPVPDADGEVDDQAPDQLVPEVEPEPEAEPEVEAAPEPEPEPAPVSFAAIGAETQRILEAAHAAGEEIRRKAESEAAEVTKARLSEAQGEVDGLRTEAATVSRQIQDLTARRREIGERLRQARETVDLALMEIDDDVDAPTEDAPGAATPDDAKAADPAAGSGTAKK